MQIKKYRITKFVFFWGGGGGSCENLDKIIIRRTSCLCLLFFFKSCGGSRYKCRSIPFCPSLLCCSLWDSL